jgi:TupA-like ATPgrasp
MRTPSATPSKARPLHEKQTTYKVRGLHFLPKNEFGDWLFALILFRRWHGRWPKRAGGTLVDAFFRLKTSAEIIHPLRVFVSDKEHVKEYVHARLGEQFNIETLACLRSLDQAMQYDFPARCVIKPTHMSGAVFLRKRGEAIDFGLVEKWFGINFYDYARERNYKTLVPKLIVEPFVFDLEAPDNYRIFCQDGQPRLIQVNMETPGAKSQAFYDCAWNRQAISMRNRRPSIHPKPANLDLILQVARTLSKDFSSIRVDLYSDGKDVKVGELTNCPYNARLLFDPPQGEIVASRLLFGKSGQGDQSDQSHSPMDARAAK